MEKQKGNKIWTGIKPFHKKKLPKGIFSYNKQQCVKEITRSLNEIPVTHKRRMNNTRMIHFDCLRQSAFAKNSRNMIFYCAKCSSRIQGGIRYDRKHSSRI